MFTSGSRANMNACFGLTLGPEFGFNDTFAMEIRGEDARRLGLKTLSEAATYTPHWRAGFGYEFMDAPMVIRVLSRDLWTAFCREAANHGSSAARTGVEATDTDFAGGRDRRVRFRLWIYPSCG